MSDSDEPLRNTPLTAHHHAQDARMGAFAGYEMPIQYPRGILAEHLHTRTAAGLFDVSHMGQAYLMGQNAATALEALVPSDISGLAPGEQRYTVLLNEKGGVLDDLMVLRLSADLLFLVVNASRKEADYSLLRRHLPRDVTLEVLTERILIALQGPQAEAVLRPHLPAAAGLSFLRGLHDDGLIVTRSGYTGEDGFEISLPADEDTGLIGALDRDERVAWVGLGARDSLRLEAGLCLYGHELNEDISPVEAGLGWLVGKRRRERADFPGATRILGELAGGTSRKRVGLRPEGRVIAREGTPIQTPDGKQVGVVTSGSFAPSLNGPVAMGYVESALAAPGTPLQLVVRDQAHPAQVVGLPFVPHRYRK